MSCGFEKKIHLIFFFVLILNSQLATRNSHADFGLTGAQFLSRDTGTRAMALGGAYTGIWGSVESFGYNPAGLGTLTKTTVHAMYAGGYIGDHFGFLGIATPWWHPLYFGLGLADYDGGRIDLNLSSGLQETRRAKQDLAAYAAAAWQPLASLSLGATLKPFQSTLAEEYKASGIAIDAGGLWRATGNESPYGDISLGLSLMNAGSSAAYIDEADPLPTRATAGAAWKFTRVLKNAWSDTFTDQEELLDILLTTDVSRITSEDTRFSAGVEIGQRNSFNAEMDSFVRFGIKTQGPLQTYHFGIGLSQILWGVDYGLTTQSLGTFHQISISFFI
ncbi:MAG: hypothetical protein HY547_09095 [Elusimicrobia bacterium]|nr:hypothetical protein [Elusimicrobiota bacterium]